jgi:hypothetical protein
MRSSTLSVLACLLLCTGIPARSQAPNAQAFAKAAASDKEFLDHVKAYMDLQKAAEKSLPGMKSSNDEAEIRAHQLALRAKVMEARQQARQGDVFSKDVAEQFRKTVGAVLKSPGGDVVRRTIAEGDATKSVSLQVNKVYPDESPGHTTPPTVLMVLPELPMELAYRFVGRSLVLLDNKTNLIVDFLPETLP